MNHLDYQHHRAQARIGVDARWTQRVVASLFPRRTGATLKPVKKDGMLIGHVDNTDRMAAYESRKADLLAEGEALAAKWLKEDDELVRARRKVMKRVAASRLEDRRAA